MRRVGALFRHLWVTEVSDRVTEVSDRLPRRIHILAAACNPSGDIDIDGEIDKLRKVCEDKGVELTVIERCTVQKLLDHLASAERKCLDIDVFHFIGHGDFDRTKDEGRLVFETAAGTADFVSGESFAEILGTVKKLRLVFLNACDSGQTGVSGIEGLSAPLILAGIPAVLSMRAEISDEAAIVFSGTFYQCLAAGDRLWSAYITARLAIRHFGISMSRVPVLIRVRSRRPLLLRVVLAAALVVLGVSVALVLWAWGRPHPAERWLEIGEPKEGVLVSSIVDVEGRQGGALRYAYLLVIDPYGECWIQPPVPLRPDPAGRWSAKAHLSGAPGGRTLLAIATQEPLPQQGDSRDSVVCPAEPPGEKRIERKVHFEGTASAPDYLDNLTEHPAPRGS